MKVFALFLVVILFASPLEAVLESNKTLTETDLHLKLFESYNPDVMPIRNKSEAIEVSIDLYVMSIDNIDEKSQTFTVRGFMENKWTDAFLKWNPEDYSGIKVINVQNENIWLPDLSLNNVYDSPTELGQKEGRSSIKYNGVSTTWPYKMYQVGCKIHIRKFPFDVQTCDLDFLSWTNPVSALKLKTSEQLNLYKYQESVEWALESYEIIHFQNPYGEDFWDHVIFRFTLRRKWEFVVINMLAPIVCIALLNLLCFVTPADCGEKITLCLSVFLTLAVFLTFITDSLPESSDEISLFGVYVGLQLICSGLTILATVMSLHLYYKDNTQPVSGFYRLLSRMFCLSKAPEKSDAYIHSNGHAPSVLEEPSKATDIQSSNITWQTVSFAFDRLCLLLSVIWNVVLVVGLVFSFRN